MTMELDSRQRPQHGRVSIQRNLRSSVLHGSGPLHTFLVSKQSDSDIVHWPLRRIMHELVSALLCPAALQVVFFGLAYTAPVNRLGLPRHKDGQS